MANDVQITVSFNITSATNNVKAMNQSLASIGVALAQVTNKGTQQLNNLSKATSGVTLGFNRLFRQLIAFQTLKTIAQLGDELQRFEAFFGRLKYGEEAFKNLKLVAEDTHTPLKGILENAQKLANAGVPVKSLARDMEILALSTKRANGGQDGLNRAVTAFANMTSKKYVSAREIGTNFIDAGILPISVIEKATGHSIQDIRKKDLPLLDTQKFQQALLFAAKQDVITSGIRTRSQTIEDTLADLQSAFMKFSGSMVQAFGPSLIKLMNILSGFLEIIMSVQKAWMKVPEGLRDAIGWVVGLTIAITQLYKAIKAIEVLIIETNPAALGVAVGTATALYTAKLGAEAYEKSHKTKTFMGDFFRTITGGPDDSDPGSLTVRDTAKIQAARDAAEALLNEAQKRYAAAGQETIAAVIAGYAEHFKKAAIDPKIAVPTVQRALDTDIAAAVRKLTVDMNDKVVKSQQEQAVFQRRIAITQATMEPDDTAAGRIRAARLEGDEEAWQKGVQSQLAIDKEGARLRNEIGVAYWNMQFARAHELEVAWVRERTQMENAANDEITAHLLKGDKDTKEIIFQRARDLRAVQSEQAIAALENQQQITEALVSTETMLVTTRKERLGKVEDDTNRQIMNIRQVRDERLRAIDEEDRIDKARLSAASYEDKAKDYEAQRIALSQQTETQIQLARINAWREANAIIIEEQTQAYDKIHGILDQIWDAALDRSKSFWSTLGNIIKNTILDAMKAIVTNHLAAMFANILGYGDYEFRGGALRPPTPMGRGPYPMGTGTSSGITFDLGAATGGAATGGGDLITSGANRMPSLLRNVFGGGSEGGADRAAPSALDLGSLATGMNFGGAPLAAGGGGFGSIYSPGTATSLPMINTPEGPAWGAGSWDGTQAGGSTIASLTASQRMQQSIAKFKDSLDIGKPILTADNRIIPWAQASAGQKLGAVMQSEGMGQLALSAGSMLALSGFQKRTTAGLVQGVAGSTMAGVGAALAFPAALGLSMAGGAVLGGGIGLAAAGLIHGGKVGMGLTTAGGALTGLVIGSMLGMPLVGLAVGAAAGAIAGGIRMLFPGMDEKVRSRVKQVYGIDIPDKKVRQSIVDIINKQYGGNLGLGIYSAEVQNIVRLYSLTQGLNANLPRPMYSATLQQSSGGLQTQPVYSNGQLVQNPYAGTTTQQWANAGLYVQLNPALAYQLFSGQVVNVLQQNPGTVAQASAAGVSGGDSRASMRTALMEPLTVTH